MPSLNAAKEQIAQVLVTKDGTPLAVARRKVDAAASLLNAKPSFGDEPDNVAEADITFLTNLLLKPHVRIGSKRGKEEDEDLSFGKDGTDASATDVGQLVALEQKLRAEEAAARSFGSVTPAAPAPSDPHDSFTSSVGTFATAIGRATTPAPPSYAASGPGAALPVVVSTPGLGVVPVADLVARGLGPTGRPPTPPILRTGYAMAQLAAAAQLEVAKAASRGVEEVNKRQVVKAAERTEVLKSGRGRRERAQVPQFTPISFGRDGSKPTAS